MRLLGHCNQIQHYRGFTRLLVHWLLPALILLPLIACSTADKYILPTTSEPLGPAELLLSQGEQLEAPALPDEAGPYLAGPGDVLLVRDLDHPDLFAGGAATSLETHQFTVLDSGYMLLPLIGAVEAAGKDLLELQNDLNQAFLQFVRKPNISVTISEYRSQKFYVLGQVNIPGAYPFDGKVKVLDAISAAGGLGEKADLQGSYVVRGDNVLPVDMYALLRKGELRQNISLAGGDVVYLADSSDRKVYVLGEVKKPGVFPMGSEPLRLIEAISMAGGLDPVTAKKGNVLLIRGSYADPTVYRLNLSDVMSLTGTETILEPGDRIYAAATGLTNWNRVMRQILPFLQGAESASQIKIDLEQ